MYKILIIEDDITIAKAVSDYLRLWGFEAEYVEDFQYVKEIFLAYDPQLVLLDISLPFYNGFHWCGELRKISKVPIVFLSSANDNMNIVMAMNMGGDDFIGKPFDLTVLVAKVQALLRRSYSYQGVLEVLEHKGAILNLGDTSLTYADIKVDLTRNDFRILQLLMENKGKVVSREMIMKRLWESDSFIDDNTLTVNMTRLRRKLEDTGLTDFITTKKGIGYFIGE
ncbi:MAG: transcriptional regulator [Herbinix sp.]|jgi:DNA-binding response OmpR family regulator|nr:transcriptional regulator [Herbinix sp.]